MLVNCIVELGLVRSFSERLNAAPPECVQQSNPKDLSDSSELDNASCSEIMPDKVSKSLSAAPPKRGPFSGTDCLSATSPEADNAGTNVAKLPTAQKGPKWTHVAVKWSSALVNHQNAQYNEELPDKVPKGLNTAPPKQDQLSGYNVISTDAKCTRAQESQQFSHKGQR